MIVQTDHDVERAVVPADLSRHYGLPIWVLSFSTRVIRFLRSFSRSLTLLQIVKFSVGVLVGTLTLLSALWALDLAMWTSVKDFREDCREQLQNFNVTSESCQGVLSRPLREPPTWRGYLGKATESISWRNNYRYVRDLESIATPQRRPREQLASRAPGPRPEPEQIFHDELYEFWEPPATGIRWKGDAEIMYGGCPKLTPGNLRVLFPLNEAQQEAYDDFGEDLHGWNLCKIWLNATAIGAVQDMQIWFIPDQRAEPLAFDEVLEFMPPSLRSERRWWCTYPPVPDSVPVNGWVSTGADLLTNADFGAALALTFILIAYGHEVIYGGFARRTRWKWQ